MTASTEELAAILTPVRHVLLDFDGPVCSVFAGYPAADVARRMAELLTGAEGPPPGHELTDPLAMLRYIADVQPESVPAADAALTQLEIEVVAQAQPTAGGVEFLEACATTGRHVWIVSNNATAAIERYVDKHGLRHLVAGCFGRVPLRPESMKPSPELLNAAMRAARAQPSECVFVGDAVRDVEAAHAAGVAAIGYANKEGKASRLSEAGAQAVVLLMRQPTDALST